MGIRVFITSVSGSSSVKKNQQQVTDALTAKKIDFELIDISSPENEELKTQMRSLAKPKEGQVNPMPPQIFSDDEYLGDYDAFFEAMEDENLEVFLRLASATKTSEATVTLGDQEGASNNNTEGEDDSPNNVPNSTPSLDYQSETTPASGGQNETKPVLGDRSETTPASVDQSKTTAELEDVEMNGISVKYDSGNVPLETSGGTESSGRRTEQEICETMADD